VRGAGEAERIRRFLGERSIPRERESEELITSAISPFLDAAEDHDFST